MEPIEEERPVRVDLLLSPLMQVAQMEFLARFRPRTPGELTEPDDMTPFLWLCGHYQPMASLEEIENLCDLLDPDMSNIPWKPRESAQHLPATPMTSISSQAPQDAARPGLETLPLKEVVQPKAWITTTTIQVLSTSGPTAHLDIRSVLDLAEIGDYRVKRETQVKEVFDLEELPDDLTTDVE
jgi:hypothetical protein